MTAKEFFKQQSTTDANNMIVDKNAHKYNRFDLIKFAQAYHESEIKKLGLFNVSHCFYLLKDQRPPKKSEYEVITDRGRIIKANYECFAGKDLFSAKGEAHEINEFVIAWRFIK